MATVPADIAAAVIKACIMLSGMEDIHESVGGMLDDIVRFSGAQGCRVMLVDHEKKEAVVFCERDRKDAWRRNAGEDDAIRYELIRSWEAVIGVSNAVIVKDEQDIADIRAVNPLWADSLRAHDVKSLVLLPLRQAKQVIGYLYVVNFDVSKVAEVKEMVELMSFFLGAEISNHLLRTICPLRQISRPATMKSGTAAATRRGFPERRSRCPPGSWRSRTCSMRWCRSAAIKIRSPRTMRSGSFTRAPERISTRNSSRCSCAIKTSSRRS